MRNSGIATACIIALCTGVVEAQPSIGIINNEQFDGPNEHQAAPGALPADNSIAVSANWLGVAMNGLVVFFDRTSDPPFQIPMDGMLPLDQFFNGTSGIDPRIVYDDDADRFALSLLAATSVKIAWANEGAPLPIGVAGNWTPETTPHPLFNVECLTLEPEDLYLDMPSLGLDHLAWYLSARTQQCVTPPDCNGADRLVIPHYIVPKPAPAGGPTHIIGPIYSRDFIDETTGDPVGCFRNVGPAAHAEITTPAIHYGTPPAAYFVGIAAKPPFVGPPGCFSNNLYALRLLAIENPLSDARELRAYHLAVPCFDPRDFFVPTPSGETVRAVDGYITSAVWQDDVIWATHSVVKKEIIGGSQIVEKKVVRWYKIATNGWPTSGQLPTLDDMGEIEGPSEPVPVHLFMPAISINDDGEVAIIMARGSSNENLSIQATGRFPSSPDSEMFDLTPIKDELNGSNSPGAPRSNRWGDYFTVVPDPSGDGTFWGFAMYMIDNVAHPENPTPGNLADDGFGTWIFHFILLGP